MEQHRFYFKGKVVEVVTRKGAPRAEAAKTAKLWARDNGLDADDEEEKKRTSKGREG